MLLSKELSYYTMFQINSPQDSLTPKMIFLKIIEFIKSDEYLQTLGDIKQIEVAAHFIEIWIGQYHFALFESSDFFVKL